jgi:small GTP-binding protein
LQQLQQLYLSNNQLTQLPKEIGQLQQLRKLDLGWNKLTQFPEELLQLNLAVKWDREWDKEGIHVAGNPFEIPPVEIVKQGRQAILDYYNALKSQPDRPLNELKLLLVGDGGAGKTSLMKRLLGQPFDPQESQTHGINLNTLTMTVPALDNTEVKLHCWDFGGQEIMHATHQFFLTKRSLYLVVLDARRETKTDYWLKQIQQISDNAPVIIVMNKIDEHSQHHLNETELVRKYPNIKQFCKISCMTQKGLPELITAIQQTIPNVELVQTPFPASWWQVKTALVEQAQTKNYTSYDHFVELCQANEINEESQQHTLITFLHELGIVTHFDQPWLRETNVINPRWLTEAVYKLVTAKQAENGKLPLTALAQLLDSKVYPSHKHDYLIGLIERFELCYHFDKNTLLFPELLSGNEPNLIELRQQIQQVDTLHFILRYSDFLPKSIFTRFLVRIRHYIDKSYLWKTGAVVRDSHATALVQLDEKEQKITLALMGSQKREFLTMLLFLLRDIHRSFAHLPVDERLALPDNSAITVSYEYLLELLKDGETEIRPEGAKKKYNIHQLLGTVYHSKPTEAEIIEFLRKLINSQNIPDERTFWQKFQDAIELKIPFAIGSIDLKNLVKAIFTKKDS